MKALKKHRLKILLIIVLVVLFYIATNVISICSYSKEYCDEKCDVAVVLGAACTNDEVSEVYKQRLNHAVDLYNRKKVNRIITTGGIGKGNKVADATVAKLYLMSCEIPEEAILEEKDSTITEENLENAKIIMDDNNYVSALIVSDPLHMKRAMLLAEDAGIKAFTSPTKTSAYKTLKTKIPFIARETFFYIGYKWFKLISIESV